MGNYRSTHKVFEPCCHYLCNELITRAIVIIRFFNTCINLTLTLEVELGHVIDVLDAFDAEFSFFKTTCEQKLLRWSNIFWNFYKLMIHMKCTICLPICLILSSNLWRLWKTMWDVGLIFVLLQNMIPTQ